MTLTDEKGCQNLKQGVQKRHPDTPLAKHCVEFNNHFETIKKAFFPEKLINIFNIARLWRILIFLLHFPKVNNNIMDL